MNKLLKLTTATILSLSILISPINSIQSFATCDCQEVNYSNLKLLEIEKSQHGIIAFVLWDTERNFTIRFPYYDELYLIPEYVDSEFKYDYANDSLVIEYNSGLNIQEVENIEGGL